MKIDETIKNLNDYNSWRRGEEGFYQPAPKVISEAIDSAVSFLKGYKNLHRVVTKNYEEAS